MSSARTAWLAYHFPGNVRELRNIVLRLLAKYPGRNVDDSQLADELDLPGSTLQTTALPEAIPDEWQSLVPLAIRRLQDEAPFSLDQMLRTVERSFIEAALRLCQGNVTQAARMLGLSRTTLYSRMDAKDKE